MPTFKIIKSKAFKAQGTDHTHYTVAYKGRLFGISTLRFPEEDLKVDENTITTSNEIEVLKNTSTDPIDGSTKQFLDIVPKSGLTLAEF